ncbi:SH3 domain-containing protein [bacterium]|nr:SH3 domain-containing protein [bacterium]
MKNTTVVLFAIVTGMAVLSCQKSENAVEPIPAVCLWDKAAVREQPVEDGKWMASLQLGETVLCVGKTAVDTVNNREYLNVRLSDGKTGWVKRNLMIPGAAVGAVKETTPLYARPDMLTLTSKSFEMLDMVAITDTLDRWIRVTGAQGRNKGWIQRDNVVMDKSEVTVAILAAKALARAGNAPVSETLSQLKTELPVTDSYFLKKLEEQASAETMEPDASEIQAP